LVFAAVVVWSMLSLIFIWFFDICCSWFVVDVPVDIATVVFVVHVSVAVVVV